MPTFTQTVTTDVDVEIDLTTAELLEYVDTPDLIAEIKARGEEYSYLSDGEKIEIFEWAGDDARKHGKLNIATRFEDLVRELR